MCKAKLEAKEKILALSNPTSRVSRITKSAGPTVRPSTKPESNYVKPLAQLLPHISRTMSLPEPNTTVVGIELQSPSLAPQCQIGCAHALGKGDSYNIPREFIITVILLIIESL